MNDERRALCYDEAKAKAKNAEELSRILAEYQQQCRYCQQREGCPVWHNQCSAWAQLANTLKEINKTEGGNRQMDVGFSVFKYCPSCGKMTRHFVGADHIPECMVCGRKKKEE